MKPGFDTCPSCGKEHALSAGARPGVMKCLHCGAEKLAADARAGAAPSAEPAPMPADEALARVTGEPVPKAPPPPAPARPASIESRRETRHEGHVRALALWTFVWGLAFLGAAAAIVLAPKEGARPISFRQRPAIPSDGSLPDRGIALMVLIPLGIFHLAVGTGMAAYYGWARVLFGLMMALGFFAGLAQVALTLVDHFSHTLKPLNADALAGAAASAVWSLAALWAVTGGASSKIFTRNYRILYFETRRDVKAHTLRSPFFWLPLLALAATAAMVFAGDAIRAQLGL